MSENNFVLRRASCVVRNTHHAIRNTKGFTLIESLVVVSILAMISLAVYSALSAGAGIWVRVNKGVDESRLLLAWEKMQKDIRNVFVFKEIGFAGKEDGVSFPGLVPVKGADGVRHDEVGRVRYYYDDKCQCLCLEKTAYIELLKNAETGCKKEIEGIKKAEFEYYGPGAGAGAGVYSWVSKWDREGKPAAIRFKVVTVGNNEKQFTTLLP